MTIQNINHFMIGVPGSGKSTLAQKLAQLDDRYIIISTDSIRKKLYGDESIQGDWELIETEVLNQVEGAIANKKLIIYDATNAHRAWRLGFLEKITTTLGYPLLWMGWYLVTPIDICKQWNKNRTRYVPDSIIDTFAQLLRTFPPDVTEGFISIRQINLANTNFNQAPLPTILNSLNRSYKNHQNRTGHYTLHCYSRLLDFERLIYLISLILKYPGIGNLQENHPQKIQEIFGEARIFQTKEDEICAIITHFKGNVYAHPESIEYNLNWLEKNSFFGGGDIQSNIEIELLSSSEIEQCKSQYITWHRYSDLESFQRLLKLIRYIAYHPSFRNTNKEQKSQDKQKIQDNFIAKMQQEKVLVGYSLSTIQKDIEEILKPCGILPDFSLKRGYFVGSAIFSELELKKLYRLLQSQKFYLDDPVAVEMTQLFQQRIKYSKLLEIETVYPTRVIGNRGIINPDKLPDSALLRKLEYLEIAIIKGQLLELTIFPKSGRFPGQNLTRFRAYPLQVVFHNIGWYLGYEIMEEDNLGLFHFERLDRLSLEKIMPENYDRGWAAKKEALEKITRLYEASPGIYLGDNIEAQQKFLSDDIKERKSVEIQVELWINDNIFKFFSEGNQRFSCNQMKMSKRPNEVTQETDKNLFSLASSPDPNFPNRFRVTLPNWSLKDIDLRRWILGFGGQVKVIKPPELVEIIQQQGIAIAQNYPQ